jgi:DNA-binding beta-propeller fold protein YncE
MIFKVFSYLSFFISNETITQVKTRSTKDATPGNSKKRLIYAGSFSIDWDPSSLLVNQKTGRVYHRLPSSLNMPLPWALPRPGSKEITPIKAEPLGLIRSSLMTSQLSKCLDFNENGDMVLHWEGKTYPIQSF